MTQANLCRPLHLYVIANAVPFSTRLLTIIAQKLVEEGFIVRVGDSTGVIVSGSLADGKLQEKLGSKLTREGFLPTSLDLSVTAAGLVLTSLSGWYASDTQPPIGEDRDINLGLACDQLLSRGLGDWRNKGCQRH